MFKLTSKLALSPPIKIAVCIIHLLGNRTGQQRFCIVLSHWLTVQIWKLLTGTAARMTLQFGIQVIQIAVLILSPMPIALS